MWVRRGGRECDYIINDVSNESDVSTRLGVSLVVITNIFFGLDSVY